MRSPLAALVPALGLLVLGCSTDGPTATSPTATATGSPLTEASLGPETPSFNLEIILRGDGFGYVKFRQPNDAEAVIYLDTWVRGLAPNTEYVLQRAVDAVVDDNCTSTAWLTLGKGLQPQSILTDADGTGRAELFRDVSAFQPGTEFDIHFRVLNLQTQAVALESACYQYRISL